MRRQKQALGIRAKSRKAVEAGPVYQIREPQVSYLIDFGLENDAISVENKLFSDVDMNENTLSAIANKIYKPFGCVFSDKHRARRYPGSTENLLFLTF